MKAGARPPSASQRPWCPGQRPAYGERAVGGGGLAPRRRGRGRRGARHRRGARRRRSRRAAPAPRRRSRSGRRAGRGRGPGRAGACRTRRRAGGAAGELGREGLAVRPGRDVEHVVGQAGVGVRGPGAGERAGAVAVEDRGRLDLLLVAEQRRDVGFRRRRDGPRARRRLRRRGGLRLGLGLGRVAERHLGRGLRRRACVGRGRHLDDPLVGGALDLAEQDLLGRGHDARSRASPAPRRSPARTAAAARRGRRRRAPGSARRRRRC